VGHHSFTERHDDKDSRSSSNQEVFGDLEMTQNKNEKRAAREFMRGHEGVSYTAALRAVRQAKERAEATGEPIIVAKQGHGLVKD
jgi:hypothetical protein